MALANVAYMLAKDSGNKGVLMVDWDLEAPGLHRYFGDLLHTRFPGDHRGRQLDAWPGLIDYFLAVHRLAGSEAGATEQLAQAVFPKIPLDQFVLQTDVPSL